MKENKTDVVEVTTKKKTKKQLAEEKVNKAVAAGAQKNMQAAKANKNDEFYTRLEDIEKELKHYRKHFKGKTILLNCDDPEWSNFWVYFRANMAEFGIKRLIATHYEMDGSPSYKMEAHLIVDETTGKKKIRQNRKIPLKGNGDFRSEECIKLMQEADIVVTNPPFSLFRELIDLLEENKKKYILIGNNNAITYKETFKLIKKNKLWLGKSGMVENFHTNIPKSDPERFKETLNKRNTYLVSEDDMEWKVNVHPGNGCWFTNVGTPADRPFVELTETYKGNEDKYPKYDNYDAININKAKDIPMDYTGVLGVPITFLHKLNTEQFEIVGITKNWDDYDERFSDPYVNGKALYARLLIKRKVEKETQNDNKQ